ncbi:MAG: RNA polymerase sigma factor [Actinobacteria bacterium]|nr:RNA polymerase sigma factor [Actinomycetota bacterium]
MLAETECAELERRVMHDPEAFGRLYELNYKRILNYIAYSIQDVDAALDLTAETFYKALRSISKFNPKRAAFTSWLYGIASREVAAYFRKRKRNKVMPMSYFSYAEDIERAHQAADRAEVSAASARLEANEDAMVISQLLRELPLKYRVILALRFFEDLSFEQIAGVLNRPVATVKTQNYRALERLKKTILERSSHASSLLEEPEIAMAVNAVGEEAD